MHPLIPELNKIVNHYGCLSEEQINDYNEHRNDGCEPLPFINTESLQWEAQEAAGIELERYFYNLNRSLCVAALADWEGTGYGLVIWEVSDERNNKFYPVKKR